ncbi:hypothetical protein ACROYT_G027928 [Oculina patagonica]
MVKTYMYVTYCPLLVSLWVCSVAALSSSNNSKDSQLVTLQGKATFSCPAIREAVEKDGAFENAYWSICTSKSCEDKHTSWNWMAGMNGQRITKVGREGINMTVDGALQIQKVRLMCTVNRINDQSPLVHFATLFVEKDATKNREKKTTNKPDVKDCKKDYSEDSGNLVSTLTATTSVLSVLLVLAVGYIVYLKRNDLRSWNQRNSSA